MAKRKSTLPYAHRKRARSVSRARSRNLRRARPMRALRSKEAYRKMNLYRFKRSTLPHTTVAHVLAASGSQPAMGYFQFANISPGDMVNFVSDFQTLFAKYKIDKIVTKLTPIWDEVALNTDVGTTVRASPQCEVVRVNGKYLQEKFDLSSANGLTVAQELAQIQAKSVCRMYTTKPIYLVTNNPKIYDEIRTNPDDAATTSLITVDCPWLSIQNQNAIKFAHNDTLFIRRLDGQDVSTDYKFMVQHEFHFRTAYVG